jgi:hypothetical protein
LSGIKKFTTVHWTKFMMHGRHAIKTAEKWIPKNRTQNYTFFWMKSLQFTILKSERQKSRGRTVTNKEANNV